MDESVVVYSDDLKQKLFAKQLASLVLDDPNGVGTRKKSRTYSTAAKEDIEGYLASPSSNEANLRKQSIYLYQINTRYRKLIEYYANIPCWLYTVNALNFNPEKVRPENFNKQYQKICNILENMKLPSTMRDVMLVCMREGVYYGVMWGNDSSSYILQKLDADNCAIVGITDGGVFQFAYDMSKVKEEDLPTHYPPEFTSMYRESQRTGQKYQMVPQEISFCIKADPTIIEYSIPPLAGVMTTLFDIKTVEDLAETATELSNYKMLSGIVPTDENGVPMMEYDVVMQYYRHIANNLGDRVGLALSPFKLEAHTFEQSGTAAQVDEVARVTDRFFASAGTSPVLHGATNRTNSVVRLALKVDEGVAFYFMEQCANAINRFLKTMSGTQKFKVNFLPVTIFNRDEMTAKYKEGLNYGFSKIEYLLCLGVKQCDIRNKAYIENNVLGIDDLFMPLKTAATQSGDNEAGRPTVSDDDISDSGAEWRDTEGEAE